ncbi:MAG TPA: DNA ligase D [Burkholderiales bacterium]|nr:DNA ligase D [Burkholderiales bacterium]
MNNKLRDYTAKRSFDATPEPEAKLPGERAGPLLFVIQQHSARRLHYDLRLECDGLLMSWAVPKGPSADPTVRRLAVRTEDHPFDYGSLEGVIPPGQYGAGAVIVWDCGVYCPDEGGAHWFHDRAQAEAQVRDGMEKGKLSLLFRGEKVKGSYALVRTAEGKNWLLLKHKDRFVSKVELTDRADSVLSGMRVEDLKSRPVRRIPATKLVPSGRTGALPEKLAPMQAELGEKPFNSADWSWEPKLDGYRAIAFVSAEGVRLRSRKGLDLATDFPDLAAELREQAVNAMVLDGELVALDASGKPSFAAMQNKSPAVYYCFDLLSFEGIDLRDRPYDERRRYLGQCLLPTPRVRLVHAVDDGIELHRAVLAQGLEGVVGKRKDSRYEAGHRSAAWIKVKARRSADFIIGGFTQGKNSRADLGALLVGYWDGRKLRYASHVGSGFDDRSVRVVRSRLNELRRKTSPFSGKIPVNAPAVWVEPVLVAEVRYQDWTDDGHLRAPVFLRLRDDLEAEDVASPRKSIATPKGSGVIDDVVGQLDEAKSASFTLRVGTDTIRLSHLDRVYWPEDRALKQAAVTKRDLLRYFAKVSLFMLPHLRDRPLTMIRMPDGIGGQRFFQKHWEQERPAFVESITVYSGRKDESHEYLLCNNLPTLLWLAQSGTLEFHVWHSRAKPGPDGASRSEDYASSLESLERSVLNYPDYVVFDIDPYIYSGKEKPGDEPELNTVAFEKGKEVAFRLRELLRSMALESIVKTSGKTGLHVFVPIRRTIDFDAARQVSELVGRHLLRAHPKDITLEWSIPKRTGKIFMDYNMNVRGKTLNVAYSPRGATGGPVSMPLSWDELASAHPLDFRIDNVPGRLAAAGDRWQEALAAKQSLERALKRAGQ